MRVAAVKRNPEAARVARQRLSAVKGVMSAEANTVTGSVTVRYDPASISHHELLHVLRLAGYCPESTGSSPSMSPESVIDGYADLIAEKVAVFVVKKALERSAGALIGALI
jgi:copper chaperone CopZ